jgi:hypothetical protein
MHFIPVFTGKETEEQRHLVTFPGAKMEEEAEDEAMLLHSACIWARGQEGLHGMANLEHSLFPLSVLLCLCLVFIYSLQYLLVLWIDWKLSCFLGQTETRDLNCALTKIIYYIELILKFTLTPP